MPSEQYVEQTWDTPPLDAIPHITRNHVQALEASDDDAAWVLVGMHHILVETIGNRSGGIHKVALPSWRDPENHRIVVASFAGAPGNPAWFTNLADRKVNPRVRCRVQHGSFWSEPAILEGDEYQQIWDLLTADRAWYIDYQAKTDRTIPLVRLPETQLID
jgi:deazaflavin-dependent oxidoreductase (nitroreductase family)